MTTNDADHLYFDLPKPFAYNRYKGQKGFETFLAWALFNINFAAPKSAVKASVKGGQKFLIL